MANIHPSLIDRARVILKDALIDDNAKADAWDAYHDARDSQHLLIALHQLPLPDEIKQRLYEAKQASEHAPLPEYLAPTMRALNKLTEIDPQILAEAEKHPALAKVLVEAALKGSDHGK